MLYIIKGLSQNTVLHLNLLLCLSKDMHEKFFDAFDALYVRNEGVTPSFVV